MGPLWNEGGKANSQDWPRSWSGEKVEGGGERTQDTDIILLLTKSPFKQVPEVRRDLGIDDGGVIQNHGGQKEMPPHY